jgi:hypothetical protein
VADQANQEATAAFAAAMTVANEGKKTPVPDDHSILGNQTSAPWTFLSNRTAVAAAAAKVADKAPVDKAAKAAKADKAVTKLECSSARSGGTREHMSAHRAVPMKKRRAQELVPEVRENTCRLTGPFP